MLVGLGFLLLVRSISHELGPRYLAAMEESMVDTAVLLTSLVETQTGESVPDTDSLAKIFQSARTKRFSAQIYELKKTEIGLSVYVTDKDGIVLYHSENPELIGTSFARFNDVILTLRGEYGARTTPSFPDSPAKATLYVAAPIQRDGEIIGSLTVGKPASSVSLFLATARVQVAGAGLLAALAVIILGVAVSLWITKPIGLLTRHAQALRDGQDSKPPNLGNSEIGKLGQAFEEMRQKLEGKQYIEQYVQSLTHEMKSPLSAIRSAAELLGEDLPPEEKDRFLKNILGETSRMQDLIDRLLQLSALEARNKPLNIEPVEFEALCNEVTESLSAVFSTADIKVETKVTGHPVIHCERFLLRQALVNLLKNAVEFSPSQGTVTICLEAAEDEAGIKVIDNGPGVPEYAVARVFDRFYSLPRPGTGKKSSGLGLAFVKEVARLHGGRASLRNMPDCGACAELTLPLMH